MSELLRLSTKAKDMELASTKRKRRDWRVRSTRESQCRDGETFCDGTAPPTGGKKHKIEGEVFEYF